VLRHLYFFDHLVCQVNTCAKIARKLAKHDWLLVMEADLNSWIYEFAISSWFMFYKYQSDETKTNFLQQGKVLLSFRPLPAILDSLSFHILSHSHLCKELIEVSATSF
jgi:hypothetical protein